MKVWLVLPPLYYLYTWFNANPTTFNTDYMAVYYDPFYGTKGLQGNIEVYTLKLLIEPHVNVKILLKIEFKSNFFERALFG